MVPRPRALLIGLVAVVLVPILGAGVTLFLNPRPGAPAIQWLSRADADAVTEALAESAPPGVDSLLDQSYDDADPDATFDVYVPRRASVPLPAVIWAHGGSWIAGDKSDYAGYYENLAHAGFTVISLNYSLGPGPEYETVMRQLNTAYGYVLAHAAQLHVDAQSIFLGGDSAGAQMASQMAAIVTDRSYAAEVGVEPMLSPEQLRGVVLACGVYDMNSFLAPGGPLGWTEDRASIWAYTGSEDFRDSAAVQQMSTIDHVTTEFPPAFVTGGNVDPLTGGQSVPFAAALSGLGVAVDSLFFADDHQPGLDHEYQFALDTEDGRLALDRTVAFLRSASHSVRG